MSHRLLQQPARLMLACLLLICAWALALGQNPPPVQPKPQGGTTLYDPLKLPTDQVRTIPILPKVGAWGLVTGKAAQNPSGLGVLCATGTQAVVYPTTELLAGPVGTIEFTVAVTTAPADGPQRVLLDTSPAGGNGRIFLALNGKKLSLAFTGDNGQTASIDANVNWAEKSPHKVNILWDANDVTLLLDNQQAGKVEKPSLTSREPIFLVLGNSRDFKAPANLAFANLRLSTLREPQAPGPIRADDSTPTLELTLKMAQGYQRRLYPMLDRLRNQGITEAAFSYAVAYSDIGDFDRAMQAVTPIANDPNNPMYVSAMFLRAELLGKMRQFMDAYNVLQTLVNTSKDEVTVVRAQVKQAVALYDQGDKSGAMKLIGGVISRYPNSKALNDAYLVIALDKIQAGDFGGAIVAASNINTFGQLRQTVPIGKPLQMKVADADLNVRISDIGLPVTLTSTSGDKETVTLRPAFSRGVYIGNVDTVLGDTAPGDGALQVLGKDHITITYIDRLSPDGVNIPRTIGVDLATDAKLSVLAQSATDIFHEAVALQRKNIVDDTWVVVSDLPETVTEFFRDPETGEVLKKGTNLNLIAFMSSIKPGQAAYIELNEPDADISAEPDTLSVDISTKNTKKATIVLKESGPHTGIFTGLVKTALAADAKEGVFTVDASDAVTVNYADQRPSSDSKVSPISIASVRVTSGILGKLVVGTTYQDNYGQTVFKNALRLGSNASVVIKLEDRDQDVSDNKDTVTIKAKPDSNDGGTLTLTETGMHTGVFTATTKLSTDAAATTGPTMVKAAAGDRIALIYMDAENPTAKETPVTYTVRMNIPEDASMKFFRKIVEKPKETKLPVGAAPAARPLNAPPPKVTWEETTTLVPGFVYELRLNDGDILPPNDASLMTAKLLIKSQNGAWAEVICDGSVDQETLSSVFKGQFFVRLGDKNSPSRAFVSQTGTVVDIKAEESAGRRAGDAWAIPALNVQGKDAVQATYTDPVATAGKDIPRKVDLRVGADAELTALNMQGNPLELLKPGMPFEAQINDANGDMTPKRDTIKATLTSSCGDSLTLDFGETDIHSGIFSALVTTAYGAKGDPTNTTLEVPFEGKVTINYQDTETIVVGPAATRTLDLATRPMAESECLLLTKVYENPSFEVETLVKLGESLYAVGAAKLATVKPVPGQARTNVELQESKRLLQRVVERFPTSDYVVESLFLTARVLKEEQKNADAEGLFQRVIKEYPDNELVPQALLQLVNLYVDGDNLDKAVETAMTLVNLFPKNALCADAFVRIATYYYDKKKDYFTAGMIYQRVCERFPESPNVDRILYRAATAYYKAATKEKPEPYSDAARTYLLFADTYKDHELIGDSLYWAASAMKNMNNIKGAYKILTRVVNELPNTVGKYEDSVRMRNMIKEMYPKIEDEE